MSEHTPITMTRGSDTVIACQACTKPDGSIVEYPCEAVVNSAAIELNQRRSECWECRPMNVGCARECWMQEDSDE